MTISVDRNPNPPSFTQTLLSTNVYEDDDYGTTLFTLEATDADGVRNKRDQNVSLCSTIQIETIIIL